VKGEKRFLEEYRPDDHPRPSVTVDLVIFTIVDHTLRVLLVRRNEHPFKGRWALPGGFVRVGDSRSEQGEDLDGAARRELQEETGLDGQSYLEQLRAFGRPGRDPRMRVISVAYYALVRPSLVPLVRAGGDAAEAAWCDVLDVLGEDAARPDRRELAFDHGEIVKVALERLRRELDRSGVAFELVPEPFTIQELRSVYEIIGGQPLDRGNFRKRFLRMLEDGVIDHARGKRPTASKPANVYRFASNSPSERSQTNARRV
jgi:8-oxo-dGTP diphosphatase